MSNPQEGEENERYKTERTNRKQETMAGLIPKTWIITGNKYYVTIPIKGQILETGLKNIV